jgi:DNA-binding FadR family transcriptional regulator
VATSEWHPVRKVRTHEQVLEQIEEQILDGRLRIGDRLPSERELVDRLGVSRASVREALRVLEAMGVVVANVGTGRTSGSIVVGQPSGALSTLLRVHTALEGFSLGEVVEIRVILEKSAAAAAAERHDQQDLDPIRTTLERMDAEDLEPREFNKLDTEFHVGVALAAHNDLLTYLMRALRDAIEREMVLAFERLPDWRRAAVHLRAEHRAILAAIEAHEGQAAGQLVERHICDFYTKTAAPRAMRARANG